MHSAMSGIERRGRQINLTSYPGGPQFEIRPGDRLS
jgi:hypothetical protein